MSRDPKMSLKELYPRCKIVSVHNGYLDIKRDNLKNILNTAESAFQICKDIPVALLAVIGPKGSGKSLFTNFLIHYLRSGCEGGWWTKVKADNDKGKPLRPGFSWASVTHPSLFQPEGVLASTSGVYLWPEPFFFEKSDGRRVLVWVLHMHVVENKEDDMRKLEKFLMVACSRVMEIRLDDDVNDTIRMLDHYWNILTSSKRKDPSSVTPEDVCNSIVYVIRTSKTVTNTTGMTDDEAKSKLVTLATHSKVPVDKVMLDHFQHVNVTWMKESSEPLHDTAGIFDPEVMKVFTRVIKDIVSTVMEDSEVVEKKTNLGEVVTLKEMINFLGITATRLSAGGREKAERKLNNESSFEVKVTVNPPGEHRHTESRCLAREPSPQPNWQSGTGTTLKQEHQDFTTRPISRIPSLEKMEVDETIVEEVAEQMEIDAFTVSEEQKISDLEWRQKREGEEAQRRERARLIMLECVSLAVSQIRQLLPGAVDQWIGKKLTPATANQFSSIYLLVREDVLKDHYGKVDSVFWGEFKELLDTNCKDALQFLEKLSEATTRFRDSIEKQFTVVGYFIQEELNEMAGDELEKLKRGKDENLFDKITLAATKLFHFYCDYNLEVINHERKLYMEVIQEAKVAYQTEMTRYIKEVPYSPSVLRHLHDHLKGVLVTAVIDACRLGNRNPEKMLGAELQTLQEELEENFLEYKETNAKTLKNLLAIATKIISSAKTEYNKKVEKVLDSNPDGLDENSLKVHHDSIHAQVTRLLETRLFSEVRPNEPLEEHRKELENYMDHYWKTVMVAENKKSLQNKRAREEAKRTEQQRIKKEETERRREQEEERQRGRGGSFSGGTRPTFTSTKTIIEKKSFQPPPSTVAELPPLIFHLKSTRILMAVEIDGQPILQTNEFEEEETPACVTIHPLRKKLVYGTEAVALLNPSGSDSEDTVGGNWVWSLADCLLEGDLNWSKSLSKGNASYRITMEFLLAFLLRKLKFAAEAQLNGRFSTAVVVVPFWLTSPQRIQVKDAVKLAGFSDAYLINEPSAAAYSLLLKNASSRPSGGEGKILVVSENADRVDACVYRYECGYSKTLEMMKHCAIYGDDKEKSKGIIKKIKKGCKTILDFFSGEEQCKSDEDKSKRKVQEECSKVVKKTKSGTTELYECLAICGNAKRWQDIVQSVAREFGNTPRNVPEDLAVLRGAAALSRNPKDIGRYIRDHPPFYLQRVSGAKWGVVEMGELPLPEGIRMVPNILPMSTTEVTYYQNEVEVGQLTFHGVPCNHFLEPALEISNEAIIRFRYAVSVPGYRGGTKERLIPAQVNWKTPNLEEEELTKFRRLLEQIIPNIPPPHMNKTMTSTQEHRETAVVNDSKTKLLQKCEELIDNINRGRINISSTFLRKQVLKQLETAKIVALQANPTPDLFQVSMKNVDTISQKYCNH